jgi:hypothetical protein
MSAIDCRPGIAAALALLSRGPPCFQCGIAKNPGGVLMIFRLAIADWADYEFSR